MLLRMKNRETFNHISDDSQKRVYQAYRNHALEL